MKRFGEELKYSRESRGISLQDISKETRINQKFIEAIEEGNFDILPQTYIRAFIRAYAKHIGLDPVQTISRYEMHAQGKAAEDKPKILKPGKTEKTEKPEKLAEPEKPELVPAEPVKDSETENSPIKKMEEYLSRVKSPESAESIKKFNEESGAKVHVKYSATKPRVNYPLLFIVIAVVIIVVVFVLLNLPSGTSEEPERPPFESVLKETEKKYAEPIAEQTKDTSAQMFVKPDSLTLGIMSDIDIWVSVRMDNDRSDRGMLTANTKKYLRAKEKFVVSASKGKHIKLYLDEKFIGTVSQSDSLRAAIVTPEGVKTIRVEKKPEKQKNELKMMDLKPLEPRLP